MVKKILVADDSEVFRGLEEMILSEHGYEMLHAANGAQAVALAAEQIPALVLLDLQMPVLDGKQALNLLKANERTKNIPVLIVSAEARVHESQELLAQGAHALLPKPLRRSQLIQAVKEALGD